MILLVVVHTNTFSGSFSILHRRGAAGVAPSSFPFLLKSRKDMIKKAMIALVICQASYRGAMHWR